jgi:hypothetical protein
MKSIASQRLFGILFYFIGATWTVAMEVQNDDSGLRRPSQSGAVVLMLIAGHFTSHTMLFSAFAYSTAAITATFIVVTCIFSPDIVARLVFNLGN